TRMRVLFIRRRSGRAMRWAELRGQHGGGAGEACRGHEDPAVPIRGESGVRVWGAEDGDERSDPEPTTDLSEHRGEAKCGGYPRRVRGGDRESGERRHGQSDTGAADKLARQHSRHVVRVDTESSGVP